MAGRSNIELVRAKYEAAAKGDFAGWISSFTADATFEEPASLPYGGVYRGHAGLREVSAALAVYWAQLRLEIEGAIEEGDSVVVTARARGRSRASDRPLDQPLIEVLRIRDGLIASSRVFLDSAAVLEVLGYELSPPASAETTSEPKPNS